MKWFRHIKMEEKKHRKIKKNQLIVCILEKLFFFLIRKTFVIVIVYICVRLNLNIYLWLGKSHPLLIWLEKIFQM